MSITREDLLTRLEQLRKEQADTLANAHAYSGAIQEAEHWLSQIDTKNPIEPSREGEEKDPPLTHLIP